MRKRTLEEIDSLAKTIYPKFNVIGETHRKNRRFVIIKCSDCGNTFERQPNATDLNHNCPYCDGFMVSVGVNDIATTDTWLIPYFKNKEDAYKYSRGNMNKVEFVCPDCGYEYKRIIKDMIRYGWSCPCCGDGISKPNKFLRALLKQLPVYNVDYEYSSSWTQGKKYDAYFEYNSNKYLVEMDGDQHHRKTNWTTLEEQQENDNFKNMLAFNNGFNLIRIDAPYNNYDAWIKNFYNSEIAFLLDKVDWQKCIEYSENSLLKEVCKYYDNHPDAIREDIKTAFNLTNRWTVTHYLKMGAKLGLTKCYSKEDIKERFDRYNRKRNGVKTCIYDSENNLIAKCETLTDCVNTLSSLLNINIEREQIRYCIRQNFEYKIDNYIVRKEQT